MTDKTTTSGVFVIQRAPGILCFPENLFTAKAFERNGKPQGEPKFGCQIVIGADHPDLADMKALIVKVANEASPGIDITAFGKPLNSGTKEADKRKAKKGAAYKNDAEFMRDKVVIKSRSKFPPVLCVIDNKKLVELSDDALKAKYKTRFFFGAEVLVEITFVWYNAMKEGDKPGVTAYVNKVIATGGGTRLSTGTSAAEAFSGYLGKLSTESPLGGKVDDDEIPF